MINPKLIELEIKIESIKISIKKITNKNNGTKKATDTNKEASVKLFG